MDATPEEHWRLVVGYEGLYEVSDLGRVRSLRKGRLLALNSGSRGYVARTLVGADGKKRYTNVHRLVLEAFVGLCPDGFECCHNERDPTNNRLTNLRWDSRASNALDKVEHGTHHQVKKTHCPRGHPYDGLHYHRRGVGRYCKECKNARRRKGRRRNQNTDKTHCKRGHEFTPETTRIYSGRRHCTICRRIRYVERN